MPYALDECIYVINLRRSALLCAELEFLFMEKVLLIMNPYAGKKQAKPYLADILELFSKNGYHVTVEMTSQRGDGITLAEQYAGEYDKVICIGGDGTLNEVINGILNGGHKTPIGYIPAGSTNDFASSLDIPKNVVKAAEKIINAKPVQLDVGKFNDRYFSYVTSFGAFTKTSFAAPQNLKNVLGRAAYILEGIKDLSSIKPIHMKFEAENAVYEDDYIFGAITNSTSVGGILSFDPEVVSMSDGVFEVFLVKSPKNIVELNECIHAIVAQKYDCPSIVFANASRGTFYCEDGIDWTVDGEQANASQVNEVVNVHNAITVLL